MESIDDFVNQLNEKTNYEEMLIGIINCKENNHIKEIFERISKNNDLTEKQKEEIYNSILDYSNEISKNFKKRIEDIHKRGFKEGSLVSFLIDSITRDDFGKRDIELDLAIEDFILGRLKNQDTLEKNQKYVDNKKEIEEIKNGCTTRNLEIVEGLEKLEELYEVSADIGEIQAYKVGFRDALKFILHKAETE